LVLINSDSNAITPTVTLPAEPAGVTSIRAQISSDNSYWKRSDVSVTNGVVTVPVPAYGVVTLYAVSRPTLRAALSAPDRLTLSWNQAPVGFALQSAGGLGPDWVNDPTPIAISNDTAAADVLAAAAQSFYRLVLP
jgi:hypothetical protein